VQELCDIRRVDNELVNNGMMRGVRAAVGCLIVAACATLPVSASRGGDAEVAAVVAAGRALHVRLAERITIGMDMAVTATVVEPVYVRDRIAIAAGTRVSGRIFAFEALSPATRARDASGGDFTRRDVPVLQFDTLTFADGRRKPIVTTVDEGRDHAAAGVREWMKEYALGQLPVHRRYIHAGAEYIVTLVEPVSIDTPPAALVVPQNQDERGRVRARLVTPIDSATAKPGMPVRVIVTQPFVDRDGGTVLEGTPLEGTITSVTRAGAMHRQGRVQFEIEGRTGVATVGDSKWRFALPVLAAWALTGAPDGDRGHLGNFLGRGGAGWSGFEMIGGAVSQASGPIAIGFGLWGLARGLWINVLRNGRDVVLPANTLVEVRPPV
jgi:hypothetical protein